MPRKGRGPSRPRGASARPAGQDGPAALVAAARRGDDHAVATLLRPGIDLTRPQDGHTALEWAHHNAHWSTVQLIQRYVEGLGVSLADLPGTTRKYVRPFARAAHGRHDFLLNFARRAAALLDPSFPGTRAAFPETREEKPYDFTETRTRFGTPEKGLELRLRSELRETGPLTWTRETVAVESYGLAGGARLLLEWGDDDLRILLEGAPADKKKALQSFDTWFVAPPGPKTVERLSQTAVEAVRRQDWPAAKADAESVLARTPQDVRSLFALGVARGASGDLAGAEEALRKVVALDPKHYDAWYNLGNVYRERGQGGPAAECYRKTLEIDADNHAAFYQLGHALEMAGETEPARAAYRDAVRTSPNPGGQWGYRGMDFTKKAEEALARLGGGGARGAR